MCKQHFHNHGRASTGYYEAFRQRQCKKIIERAAQLVAMGRARKIPCRTWYSRRRMSVRKIGGRIGSRIAGKTAVPITADTGGKSAG